MKVAVIGSGAAATGVLAGLERFATSALQITVFDIGKPIHPVPPNAVGGTLSRADISHIYQQLHATHGASFPPPKTHFGQGLSKLDVAGRPLLWNSEHRGGLTNFWGGGMFPFTEREFAQWPVTADAMDPYYRIIADKVGVCGESDQLSAYFKRDYINRPPLQTSPVINALRDTINRHSFIGQPAPYRVVAGSSRLALETRSNHQHSCVYCGECMLGCARASIWSAGRELDRYQASGLIHKYVAGRVLSVKDRHVHCVGPGEDSPTTELVGPFDRIYIAAGCIGSTEIVMRSFGLTQGPQMLDTSILTFPVVYLGSAGGLSGGPSEYFSLCNMTMMGIPDDNAAGAIQVSIYPAFDHLWRYYTPEPLWGLMNYMGRIGRWRLMLGRVYLGGAGDRRFNFQIKNDKLNIEYGPPPVISPAYQEFLTSLRNVANHSGFFIPDVRPIGHGTSSHYASTMPYGGTLVDVHSSGKIAPGIYLADAAAFPSLPAISPTFTIMANACRTAHESLQD